MRYRRPKANGGGGDRRDSMQSDRLFDDIAFWGAFQQIVYMPLSAYLIVDRDLTAVHEPLGWDLAIQLNLK